MSDDLGLTNPLTSFNKNHLVFSDKNVNFVS